MYRLFSFTTFVNIHVVLVGERERTHAFCFLFYVLLIYEEGSRLCSCVLSLVPLSLNIKPIKYMFVVTGTGNEVKYQCIC